MVFKQRMDYHVRVNGIPRLWRLALAGLAFTGPAAIGFADTADNPYRVITERNAFGLKPSIVPTNTTTDVAVKTDIKLTGIAKVNGIRKAYLATPDTKAANQFHYYEMKENRPDDPCVIDGIEVVEIDEAKQTVKIRQGASELVLDFDKHGFKPTATAAPPPIAGRPGPAPAMPNAPALTTAATTAAAPTPVIISRGVPAADSTAPASRDVPSTEIRRAEDSSSGLTRIPTRQVRTASGYTGSSEGAPVLPQMNPEEAYTHMEAVRRAAEQRGIPLPPTPPLPGMATDGNQEAPAVPLPGSQNASSPNPTGK